MKIKGVHSIDSQQSRHPVNYNTVTIIIVITVIQSNPIKKDTEGAIENAHINGLSILSRLN